MEMRTVRDLQRTTSEVLGTAQSSTVLIQDRDATFALEPWANWQYEHGILAAMSQLAESPDGATGDAGHDVLARVTQAVLQGSLAPLADLQPSRGPDDESTYSVRELQR